MDPIAELAPPVNDPNPAPPTGPALVTPELLFLNQGTTYRLGAAFAGTANPTVVWQQMIDNSPAAMMYYRELEAKDDDIAAAIAEMKLSVLSRGWKFVPADESAQAIDAAHFCQSQLESLPTFRNVLNNLLDAPFYGYTIAELMFDTSMGQAALTDIVDCPQELFCFAPAMYPQVGALRLKEYAGSTDGALVPEQKFLTFTSRPRHGNRMGSPILRDIYWASWFKRNCQRFWLRLAERGPGTAVVVHKDGADADEKRKALSAAQALIEEVAIAVPESFRVMEDLLKGTRSADPSTYEKLYNMLESKIYRRIVGGTLTSHGSDGGKGTHALGKVHEETKEQRSIDLCLDVSDAINRQLLHTLTLWNFGPDCPAPKIAFAIEDEADLGEEVTTDDALQQMGLPLGKKAMYLKYGVSPPESPEDALLRPAAPATAIVTPAGSPDKPQFSSAQQHQVDQDTADLDRIFAELRAGSLAEHKQRVAAVVAGVEHGRG